MDVLNVDNLNAEEVGKKVKEWVDFCIEYYKTDYKSLYKKNEEKYTLDGGYR